jgi:hypothetical protein
MLLVVIVALALALVIERFKREQEIRDALTIAEARAVMAVRAAEMARVEAEQARADADRKAQERSQGPR